MLSCVHISLNLLALSPLWVPQRCRSVRSVSMGRTVRLLTARRRLTCGPRRGRARWAESCCLIRWAAQRDGRSASPDCCSSTWACSCSSVRWDHSLWSGPVPFALSGFTFSGALEQDFDCSVSFVLFLQECFDSKPRIISKRSKENLAVCSNLTARHPFDDNKWVYS